MPRKHPIQKSEAEIGARLLEFRRAKRCPRRYLAMLTSAHPSVIKRIELGRAALKYDLAVGVIWELGLNPTWLATGIGEKKQDPAVMLPSPQLLKVGDKSLFSEVYSEKLAAIFEQGHRCDALSSSVSDLAELRRATQAGFLIQCLLNWTEEITDERLPDFILAIQNFTGELVTKFPHDDAQRILKRRLKRFAEERHKAEVIAGEESASDNKEYIDIPKPRIVGSGMNSVPTWPQLRKLIVQQTAARGAKAALATKLGVSRQVLNNWLGSREQGAPNAELTLKLLDMFWKSATK